MIGSQAGSGNKNELPQLANLFPDEPAAGGLIPTGMSNTNQLTPQGLQMMQQGGQGVGHILNYIRQQRELRQSPITQPQADPNESPWQMMA